MTDMALDYEPARVHIVKDDTRGHDAKRPCQPTSKTYVAGNTPELILPRSAARRCATIMVLGVVGTAGNAILADNEADAQAAVTYTQTSTIGGAGIQPGMFIHVYHGGEVWLARLGST